MKKIVILINILGICLFITCKKSGDDQNSLGATASSPNLHASAASYSRKNISNPTPTTTTTTTANTPTSSSTTFTSSPAISLNGVSNQVLSQLDISGSGANCIDLSNCSNITINNCILHSSTLNGVHLYNCKNITITNCFMYNVATGVYAEYSSTVNVNHNQVANVQGPLPRGQMVQFNNVSGSGNVISYNICENVAGQSNPEDVINLYKTNGTASSPVQVIGNWIRGGGPSTTGGGIMLGDQGGSYMIAQDNILVNPGQYGVAIASGTNIQVLNNKIFSTQQSYSNVGLYIWNQYNTACSLNTISGNQVSWKNSAGTENDGWNSGNCGAVSGWSANTFNAPIDASILPAQIITK